MQVIVDPSTIKVSKSSKLVTGSICIVNGSMAFPETNWDDFVNVLLLWWSEELFRLTCGAARKVKLRFMDGPFSVDVVYKRGRYSAYFKERNKIESICVVEMQQLILSLLRAGDSLLSNHVYLTQIPDEASKLRLALKELSSACQPGHAGC